MRMPAVAHVSKAGKQAVSSSLAWPARGLACFYSRNRLQASLAKADRPALPALALEDTVLTGAFSTECAHAGAHTWRASDLLSAGGLRGVHCCSSATVF